MNLDLALTLLAGLVGLPALWSVVIDLLKYIGLVTDGNAGKWNAGFSIVSLVVVLVAVNFFPQVDLGGIDAMLVAIAKIASIMIGFITQVWVAKGTHAITSRVIPAFSFSRQLKLHPPLRR